MLGNQDVGNQGKGSVRTSLYWPDPPGIDLRQACQLQLEQLLAEETIAAAWMVVHSPERGQVVLRIPSTPDAPALDCKTTAYLESEAWLTEALPSLKLTMLPVAADAIYACLLGRGSRTDYLLIWAAAPLSDAQQQTIEQHAQILSFWLLAERELTRQQGEIQLLEQILQRAEHQLRNPLAVISLYAENLRLELAEGTLHEQATLIRDTVHELSHNLTDLIHCGQRSQLRVAPYDLRLLLIESIRNVQPWLEQKQLHVEYPIASVLLLIDGWQMKQVLSNLLDNAIHFSPSGGTIAWNWCIFQTEVLVELRDQGPGLSDEDLQHAFTPFYSRRPGGTGLGLAIAKKIILDHQGSLWVQNLPTGGAQFSFTLPKG